MSTASQDTIPGHGLRNPVTSDAHQTPRQKPLRRGYVACIPCRTRKVRCVLDAEPPCAKCKREHRQCIFEDQHKSLRHRDPPQWAKKPGTSAQLQILEQNTSSSTQAPPTGGVPSSTQCYPRPNNQAMPSLLQKQTPPNMNDQRLETSPASTNQSLSESLLSSVLPRPGNALDVLFDAASAQTTQPTTNKPDAAVHRGASATVYTSPQVTSSPPQFQGSTITHLSIPSNETLDLWDKSRFVRQGLVTAQEVVTYLDL